MFRPFPTTCNLHSHSPLQCCFHHSDPQHHPHRRQLTPDLTRPISEDEGGLRVWLKPALAIPHSCAFHAIGSRSASSSIPRVTKYGSTAHWHSPHVPSLFPQQHPNHHRSLGSSGSHRRTADASLSSPPNQLTLSATLLIQVRREMDPPSATSNLRDCARHVVS